MAQKLQDALNTVREDNLTHCVVIHFHTTHPIDFTVANVILESSQELQKRNIQVIISGLSRNSEQELNNVRQIYPTPSLGYFTETGLWNLEKHKKVQEFQK